MKNILKTISLTVMIFITGACNDVVEVENLGAFDPSAVWNDTALTEAYLADLYSRTMPGGWPARTNAYTDGGSADETLGTINADAVASSGHVWDQWNAPYNTIRRINVLFAEIENGTLDESFKNKIKGQAHFLRAWMYFHLVRVYGGVPLLDTPQTIDDDLFIARNSTADTFTFTFIENDLTQSNTLFAGEKFADGDRGRIGAAAALAFAGRVALYKASPQFNPSNPYDNSNWAAALTANETALTQVESMGFGLVPDYKSIWDVGNEGNSEAILSVVFSDPDRTNGRNEAAIRPLSESANATGGDVPIWKFVESHPMADGYQPGSSPNYTYDVQTYWENRDPRFYANIVGNGFVYELSGQAGRRQYTDVSFATEEDRFDATGRGDRTGFFPRKGVQEELAIAEVALNSVDWIAIRYTEVLLNFAEAANEMGRGVDAVEAIRSVRARAGIEVGVGNSYGVTASSRDEIRNAIYHERYIEFSYEGKRFWDLRRARRLHTVLDGIAEQGLYATLKTGLPVSVESNTYGPADFDYVVRGLFGAANNVNAIPESYYFFPIPLNQIQVNDKLVQNSDWGGAFNPAL